VVPGIEPCPSRSQRANATSTLEPPFLMNKKMEKNAVGTLAALPICLLPKQVGVEPTNTRFSFEVTRLLATILFF
jgi:hypothetical protein